MFKWMNGYTLLTFVLGLIFLLNTVLRVLFNAPSTILVAFGLLLLLFIVWFTLVNLAHVIVHWVNWVNGDDGNW